MKKYLAIFMLVFLGVYMFGCRKKEVTSEGMQQEPMSMEALSTQAIQPQAQVAPETKAQVAQAPVQTTAPAQTTTVSSVSEPKLESLPPSGPYKPTVHEIQTALKNAGYYTGAIDGKSGPLTKKAMEDFQKANSLQADGKVGPKTWALLSKYLNLVPAPAVSAATATQKR